MHLAFLALAFLAGGGDVGSPAWFAARAKDAEEIAKTGDEAAVAKAIEQMSKTAAGLPPERFRDDMGLFTQWKKGVCEYWLGDLNQSVKTLEAIESQDKNQFFRHYFYVDLADAYLETGRAKKAEPCYQKSRDLAAEIEKKGAKRQFAPAEALRIQLQLARCKLSLGELPAAKEMLVAVEDSIFLNPIKEASKDETAELQAEWQILRAETDLNDRNLVSALKRLETNQKELEAFPENRKATYLRFNSLLRLARDYWLLARFPEARARLDLAEKVVQTGKLYRTELGLADIKNARAALTLEESHFALEEEPQLERVLSELDAAEKHLRAAIALHGKRDRGQSSFTAAVDFHLAQLHELRGRALTMSGSAKAQKEFQEGQKHCQLVIEQYRKVLFYPENHDRLLEARQRSAWLHVRAGDPKAGRDEAEAALKLFGDKHKENDLDRGRYLHVLVEAESRLGNAAKAAEYAEAQRKLADFGLGTLVAGLSAAEQIQFFRKWDTPGLNASLRLGVSRAGDEKIAAATAEWLINGKAKLAEVIAEQIQATRKADRQTFVRFQKSVQRQAFVVYGDPSADPALAQQQFLLEESKKRDLADEAARKISIKPYWYTLDEIRAQLRADEIYVGIYCLRPTDESKRIYYAWIVPRIGRVQMVQLGDARVIESLVRTFLREQERYAVIAPGTESQAEQVLRETCLNELSRLVFHPLVKLANGSKRWVISPDGPLWNLPWSTLLMPDNDRYAIEEYTFRYAVTGKDLVKKAAPADVGAPLILGDPWFDYSNKEDARLRKPGVDPLRIPFGRLEFSRRECDAVFAIFNDFNIKSERRAGMMLKEHLTELSKPPRFVYLSTHAYATLPSRVDVADPLLSCALAFAGWNYVPKSTDNAALPWMMTGAEVTGLDLHGTELVVLASCQPGIETLSYGQSPANLRHAFHLAGARSVVSALWATNTSSTSIVMEPFMENVCQPATDKVDALRDAQRQAIRYLRMYRDHSHPFAWAAFTISGS